MYVLEMVLRTLIGAPLFLYMPGYLLDRRWNGTANPLTGIERIAARTFASVLLTGSLALILAEFGFFSYLTLVLGTLALCGASWMVRPANKAHAPSERRWGRFDLLLAAIVVAFAVLVARPFEVVRGGLDAGVYANTGVSIARTGGIVGYDAVVAEIGKRAAAGDTAAQQIASNMLGVQNSQRFEATRLRAAGFFISTGDLEHGRVVPQFFHLWPTWIAVWVTMLGSVYGLAATGIAGTLGVVFAGLIGRRIAGATAGVLAAAFLATMSPQVWFSRMPTSEALTQALLLGGCWAFMHFADATTPRQRMWWGAVVGFAFGQLALTRIDFPLALAPLVLLIAYVAVSRRWHAGYTALTVVLALVLLHSALHIIFIARAYFIDTTIPTLQKYALTINLAWPLLTPELQEYSTYRPGSMVGNWERLAVESAAVVALIASALVLRWRSGAVRRLETLVLRWRRPLLGVVVLALGLLAGYAYFIRPGILNAAALSNPFAPDNWLRLQGYIGAPIAIPFDQFPKKPVVAVAQANMARMGWYLSPLGVVLGVVGALRLWWRIDRRTWLLIAISTIYSYFFIQSLYGTQDQTYIYILRRYVPIVFPAFVFGIVVALDWLRREKPEAAPRATLVRPTLVRRLPSGASGIAHAAPSFTLGTARRATSGVLAAALLVFFVVTGRTIYVHTEYGGMLTQLKELSAAIGSDDIVLLRGGGASDVAVRDTSELIAAPLTYVYGRNAFPVKGRTPGKYPQAFGEQVTRWRDEGRRVFLVLSASGGDLVFPGYVPRAVGGWTLRLVEFQQLSNQKPKLSYINDVPFQLYELTGDAVWPERLGPDDTASQVAGFYRSETPTADKPRASWTDGAGILRLPATLGGRTISLDLASGERPSSIGAASVCPAVAPEPTVYPEGGARAAEDWIELGCFEVGADPTTLSLTLPQATRGTLLLRLRSQPWVPADTPADPGKPASGDRRPLGVQFVGIR